MILNQAKIKQFSFVKEGACTLGVLGAEGTSVGRPDSSRLRCKRGAPLAQRHLVLDTPAVCPHPSGIKASKMNFANNRLTKFSNFFTQISVAFKVSW